MKISSDKIRSVFLLIIILYIFLLSIKLMSGSFKLFGNGFAEEIFTITTNPFVGLFMGILATSLVQSSSVTTSLIVPFAGIGILTLEKIFPYVLGANIGTTITGILAALATGSSAGITIALVHLLFNIAGILMIYPIKNIPLGLARRFSDLSLKSRSVPVFYVVSAFFLVPLVVIFIV